MGFWLFSTRKKRRKLGEDYYGLVRDTARNAEFFGSGKVADTVDGRFELLVLHVFLLMWALQRKSPAQRLDQLIFDVMFRDMDAALRELGTSDTQVGKKIKAMAEAFYGRSKSYREALEEDNSDKMQIALVRNVFGETTDPAQLDFAKRLNQWVFVSAKRIDLQTSEQILRDGPDFAECVFY